jgi:hypothetical protein
LSPFGKIDGAFTHPKGLDSEDCRWAVPTGLGRAVGGIFLFGVLGGGIPDGVRERDLDVDHD